MRRDRAIWMIRYRVSTFDFTDWAIFASFIIAAMLWTKSCFIWFELPVAKGEIGADVNKDVVNEQEIYQKFLEFLPRAADAASFPGEFHSAASENKIEFEGIIYEKSTLEGTDLFEYRVKIEFVSDYSRFRGFLYTIQKRFPNVYVDELSYRRPVIANDEFRVSLIVAYIFRE